MVKEAKKDEAEKEDEEAERLVRKSPDKKPPRKDKERGRMEVEDKDLDDDDPDMSMNYKDIGGTVVLAQWVAHAHAKRMVSAAMSEEEFLDQKTDNPNTDSDQKVKIRTLKDKPKNTPGRQKYEKLRKKWKEQREEEKGEDKAEDKKPKKKDDKPKPKKDKKDKKPEKSDEEKFEERVEQYEELATDDVYDLAESGSEEEQEAALQVIRNRKGPFPKDFPGPEEFSGGGLSADQEGKLKEQIKNWDLADYSQNMKQIEENLAEALATGDDKAADYFKAVSETYQDSQDAMRNKSLKDEDVNSPDDLMPETDDLDQPFDPEGDSAALQRNRTQWYQAAMFSSANDVQDMLDKVEEQLQGKDPDEAEVLYEKENEQGQKVEVKEDTKPVDPNSKRGVYLNEMKELFTEVREKKMFDKETNAGRFVTQIQEESDNPALKDLDPDDFDFTDTEEQDAFVDKVRNLEDKDLVELVKGIPTYRMYFGNVDESSDPENVSITDREKRKFIDTLSEDLKIKGAYEQMRFTNTEDDNVFDKGSLLLYRDEVVKDLMESGGSLEESEGSKEFRGFWGTFLDWMDDMVEDANKKESSVTGRAVREGISAGLKEAGVKKAQYRGLPGPLDDTDPYKPPSPKWRLPESTQDLHLEDYMAIVKEARKWLKESYLTHVLVEHDFDMACRLALDYSIYTASDYKYNGAVGHPAYNKLLEILHRIEGKD